MSVCCRKMDSRSVWWLFDNTLVVIFLSISVALRRTESNPQNFPSLALLHNFFALPPTIGDGFMLLIPKFASYLHSLVRININLNSPDVVLASTSRVPFGRLPVTSLKRLLTAANFNFNPPLCRIESLKVHSKLYFCHYECKYLIKPNCNK